MSILFFALADLWLAFPQLDLAVASQFGTPEVGFAARGAAWEQFMYGSIDELLVIIGLGLIGAWAVTGWCTSIDAAPHRPQAIGSLLCRLAPKRLMRRVTGRRLMFLLLLLALVPGLIVNQVFKEHWGRARPIQVEHFGGNRSFTPPFVISDQGGGSFSSGHVAAAAWLVAVPVVLFGLRSIWTRLALLYLLAMVLARLAAGAHFFSDALTSILLVWMGFLILQRLFPFEQPFEHPIKHQLEHRFASPFRLRAKPASNGLIQPSGKVSRQASADASTETRAGASSATSTGTSTATSPATSTAGIS